MKTRKFLTVERKYDAFPVPKELRAQLELKLEEYRTRLQSILAVHLFKTESDSKLRKNHPTKSYRDALYKIMILEIALREEAISYPFAVSEVKKIGIKINEKQFRDAYEIIRDYCLGALALPEIEREEKDSEL